MTLGRQGVKSLRKGRPPPPLNLIWKIARLRRTVSYKTGVIFHVVTCKKGGRFWQKQVHPQLSFLCPYKEGASHDLPHQSICHVSQNPTSWSSRTPVKKQATIYIYILDMAEIVMLRCKIWGINLFTIVNFKDKNFRKTFSTKILKTLWYRWINFQKRISSVGKEKEPNSRIKAPIQKFFDLSNNKARYIFW